MDWHDALSISQQYGIADSASFPLAENESHLGLVDKWREAVAKQLLTPAPDLGAVTWKRAKLKSGDFSWLPIEAPRVERAIADDLAFLAAHPVRQLKRSEGQRWSAGAERPESGGADRLQGIDQADTVEDDRRRAAAVDDIHSILFRAA
jgi:hypothetical protein